jgi:hypothetical protein
MMIDDVRSGSSYQSQSDLRLHFGLGAMEPGAGAPEIEVRWPSGAVQTVKLPGINRVIAIVEGEGMVAP